MADEKDTRNGEIHIEDGDIEEEVKQAEDENRKAAEEKEAAGEESKAASAEPEEAADTGKASDSEDAQKSSDSGDTEKEEKAAEDKKGKASDDGFFKKKKKKDPKDEKIAELTDKVQRQLAEFDNFRKRTEKEKSQMFDVGAKSIIEKILPVVDNFERGLEALSDEDKESPIAEGMEKIYKQLITTLKEAGVEPIEAEGKEFDPNFHNAVMHIEDENFGENVVAKEFQKGYTYHDTVVRHSMVQVAN